MKANLTRAAALAMAAAMLAVGIAACGSSSSGSTTVVAATAGGPSSPGVRTAQAAVKGLLTAPTQIGPTTPLSGSVRGKRVDIVQCLAPICVRIANATRAALQQLGVSTGIVNSGATPDTINQAYNQVVVDKPNGVLSIAIPTVLWKQQLQSLASAGTTVVLAATDDSAAHQGVTATFYSPSEVRGYGGDLANWVVASSGGRAKVLYVAAPEFTGLQPGIAGFRDRLKQLCGSCTMDVLNTKSTDVGKNNPSLVVSYLQAHPGTNYVVCYNGDCATGVPQAIVAAGISGVHLVTQAGGPVNYQYIKQGLQDAALTVYIPPYGWQIADSLARGILKDPIPTYPTPQSLITKTTLKFDPSGDPPFGTDYQAEFHKLWAKSLG